MTETLLEATVSVRGVLRTAHGETLVVRRASDGVWELPGGRMGPTEDVECCLRREMDEETTLEVAVQDTVHANAWQNDDEDGRFAVYYGCRTTDRDVELSEEHEEYRWVAYDEATSLLPDPQATAVRNACADAESESDVETTVSTPPLSSAFSD